MGSVLFLGLNRPQLASLFSQHGFSVTNSKLDAYGEIREHLQENKYAAIVLSAEIKYSEGLVRHVRRANYDGIVMKLEEKTEDFSCRCVDFLDAGADNVLASSSSDEEVFRLTSAGMRLLETAAPAPVIRIQSFSGELVVDSNRKRALLNGELLELTAREYGTLQILASHKDGITTGKLHQILYEAHYDNEYHRRGNMVQVFICRLRKKLAPYFTIGSGKKGTPKGEQPVYKILPC